MPSVIGTTESVSASMRSASKNCAITAPCVYVQVLRAFSAQLRGQRRRRAREEFFTVPRGEGLVRHHHAALLSIGPDLEAAHRFVRASAEHQGVDTVDEALVTVVFTDQLH